MLVFSLAINAFGQDQTFQSLKSTQTNTAHKAYNTISIGTTAPEGMLHVHGFSLFHSTSSDASYNPFQINNSSNNSIFKVLDNQSILIGTSTLLTGAPNELQLYAQGVNGPRIDLYGDGGTNFFGARSFSSNPNLANSFFFMKASGSATSPLAVGNSFNVVNITGQAHDGTGFKTIAQIRYSLDSSGVATGSLPSKITFHTTALNSVTAEQRMIINPSGNIGISTDTPKAILDVKGGVYISSSPVSQGPQFILKSPDESCSACGPSDLDVWACASVTCPWD